MDKEMSSAMIYKPRIGDVIEFKHTEYQKDGWLVHEDTLYVGRIRSITLNIGEAIQPEHPVELWLEYYNEMHGCMYITPENVVRLIEQGKEELPEIPAPPIKLGTLVSFTDGENKPRQMDRICGADVLIEDENKIERWQYHMEFAKYHMGPDEFKVEQ